MILMNERNIIVCAIMIFASSVAMGCSAKEQKRGRMALNAVENAKRKTADRPADEATTANSTADSLRVKDITAQTRYGYRAANRGRHDIDVVVVHSNYHVVDQANEIFDFDVQGCIDQFRQGGVAPHYMITRDGTVLKMVDEKNVAWHAGRSALPDGSRTMLNTSSIGIEIISMKRDGPTEAQYRALHFLLKDLCNRYDIKYLTRHSDIAVPQGRKDDPWGMDWKRVVDDTRLFSPNIITFDVPVKDNPQFK